MKITFLTSIIALILTSEINAQQASALNITSLPTTAKVGATVNLSAKLADAWDGHALAGRIVSIEVGDRYSCSSTGFNSSNQGVIQRTWAFYSPGTYRVSFKFSGDGTYQDMRVTRFITITR
jgi:hypothetical protein